MITVVDGLGVVNSTLDKEDINWLEHVRANGELLEIFDRRDSDGLEVTHKISDRIEVYYVKGEIFDDVELTVFIKIKDDTIVGFEAY